MSDKLNEQIWALSALFLAASGVVSLAHKGQWEEDNFLALLPSLQRFNPEHLADLYDNHSRLAHGRDILVKYFSKNITDDLLGYVMQTMFIAKKLEKNKKLMNVLIRGLTQTKQKTELFGMMHSNVFAAYSSLYQETASLAANRVLIRGNPNYLHNSDTSARMRTLLLCAIRAASLWQANGGSKLQLLFSRKALTIAAKKTAFTTKSAAE